MLYHIDYTHRSRVEMAVVFKSPPQAGAGRTLDRAAICVSAACLVQCVMLSIVVVAGSVVSLGFLAGDTFHLLLLAVIVPLSMTAFAFGYRVHRNSRLLVPGAIGLCLVLTAAVLEATLLGPLASSFLTSLGGLFLILGHWLNLRHRRRARLQPQS